MNRTNRLIVLIAVIVVGLFFSSYFSPDRSGENIPEQPQRKFRKAFQQVTPPPMPDELWFAGEAVPIHNYDVRESLDRELIVNSYFHSQTIRFFKLAPRYFSVIEPILEKYNIPDDFKYLAIAESGFNPRAVSPAGAIGLWQIMQGTARDYGLEVSQEIDERYHVEKSTEAACKYLLESYERYGNWTTVAASYNVGRAGIDRQRNIQNEDHYYNLLLNEETARYVFRILAIKTIMENPLSYGFNISESDLYPVIPYRIVEVNGPVENFADFASEHNINYKILKDFNPWLRQPNLLNPNRKTYEIRIPEGDYRSY